MRRFNPLGLLALLSVIAVLGFLTDNKGWFGFLGFFYYTLFLGVAGRIFSRKRAQNSDAVFFRQLTLPHPLCVSLLHFL